MKTLLLFILCAFSTQAQLTLRSAHYPTLFVATQSATNTFNPTNDATLALWLRADQIDGAVHAGRISQWQDRSGNGNNANQGNVGGQPFWFTNTVNGLPVVRFNGTANLMGTTHTAKGTNSILLVFALKRSPSYSTIDALVVTTNFTDVSPRPGFFYYTVNQFGSTTTSFYNIETGGGVTYGPLTNGASGGTTSLVVGTYYVGSATVTNNLTGSSNLQTVIGAMNPSQWFGENDIAEILIYDRGLSSTEMKAAENYLGTKYAITISP